MKNVFVKMKQKLKRQGKRKPNYRPEVEGLEVRSLLASSLNNSLLSSIAPITGTAGVQPQTSQVAINQTSTPVISTPTPAPTQTSTGGQHQSDTIDLKPSLGKKIEDKIKSVTPSRNRKYVTVRHLDLHADDNVRGRVDIRYAGKILFVPWSVTVKIRFTTNFKNPRETDVVIDIGKFKGIINTGSVRRHVKLFIDRFSSSMQWVRDVAFANLGRSAYPAAAATMKVRHLNKPHEKLTQQERDVLRPYFGSLVDKVRITYGADPIEKWGTIQLNSFASAGQTYGYDIYIRKNRNDMSDAERLRLLVHEMVHSRQFERFGRSLENFGYQYFLGYARAGYSYANNALEREADQFEAQIGTAVVTAYQSWTPPSPATSTIYFALAR